jgi:peroxiredoxin
MKQPALNPWFDIGDTIPSIDLKLSDGKPKPPNRMAGAVAVIHVSDDAAAEEAASALEKLRGELAAMGAAPFLVRRAAPVRNLAMEKKLGLGFPVLADEPGALAHNVNLKGKGTLLIGPDTRLLAVLPVAPGESAEAHFAAVMKAVGQAAPQSFRPGPAVQAPVVPIPRALSPDWCRWLIHVHDTQGSEPSGFMQQEKGKGVLRTDPSVKVRRDHVIASGSALEKQIEQIFARRVIPEIQKATHCPIQRHEEFKIVRYSGADGGHFRAHRDNTTAATQTRKFAVTLNLNTGADEEGAGDYTGGYLVFPESGDFGYRPGPGDAVAFSCSLLHEARPVTSGERYVLLAFLH